MNSEIIDSNFGKVNDYAFPLELKFNIGTFSNDFTIKDANGTTINYVKQKLFKFVEEVTVYNNETQSAIQYTIKANQWIDFSATYNFTNPEGKFLGCVARKGWASMFKAKYEVFDENKQQDLIIEEDNALVKFFDALLGEIPIVGLLTGYFFNPTYSVKRPNGTAVAQLKKNPSFWGRKFSVEKLTEFEIGEEERIILSLMMMILLERRRG